MSSNGDQAVSSTGAVCPLARGRISGSFVGKPDGTGGLKGENIGRRANACYRYQFGPIDDLQTYSSARDLPVYRQIFPSSRNEISVPGAAADLGILVMCFGPFTIDVSIL